MSAVWQKNEVVAVKRRCGLLVAKNDGTMAPRSTDFASLGYVYICGTQSPDFIEAGGTVTNQRRLIPAVDDVVESTDTGADSMTLTGHAYETGDGPFVSDEALGSIGIGTSFWIIVDDVDNIAVATSLANAYAGTREALTGTETGATISKKISGGSNITRRGLDGHFIFEAVQAETVHDAPETIVIIDGGTGSDYDRDLGGGAYTTVDMQSAGSDLGSAELENGLTRDDAWRLVLRTLTAKFSKLGNDYQFRDMADSKDSHNGTVTSAGRIDAAIDDAT